MKTASVKVMRSYDYCHFEINLSSDGIQSLQDINELRISAAKLVDHAVDQYKEMKKHLDQLKNNQFERDNLRRQVTAIKENFPKSEWTPEQRAKIKHLTDMEHDDLWEYEDNIPF